MAIPLLLLVITFGTCQSLFVKLYTGKYPGAAAMAPSVFTVLSGIIVALVTFVGFSHLHFDFNALTVVIGIVNGAVVYGYNYFLVKASAAGPYSIVLTFLQAGGILIPIISSLIMGWDSWDSTALWILNCASILLIIVSIYMVSVKKNGPTSAVAGGAKVKFILYSLGVGICNGTSGAIVTMQQRLAGTGGVDTRDELIVVKYLSAALIAVVIGIIGSGGRRFFSSFRQSRLSALFLILASLVAALSLNLFSIIVPLIPTTVLYTFNSSSTIILSAAISALLFKEKLSLMNVVGLILICISLTTLSVAKEFL